MPNEDDYNEAGSDEARPLHDKKLKRARGMIKKRLTEFNKAVNARIASAEDNGVKRNAIIEIETRVDAITPLLEQFNTLHIQICENDDESDDEEMENFERSYFTGMSNAKQFIETYGRQGHDAAPSEAGSSNSGRTGVNAVSNAQIKLPTIQLPKFKGAFTQWLEFRDTFVTLIHNNPSLSDIQKFYYLKSSLEGDAAQTTQAMEISAGNYETAWLNLCERYENKRLLIANHIRALFNLENLTKESPSQLREMLDTVNQHLRSLRGLGQPVEHWDTMIVFLVTNKFDLVTAREWESLKSKNDVPTLDELKLFLRTRSEMLETLGIEKGYNKKCTKDSKTSRSFATTGLACYYCKGSHTIYNCTDFIAKDPDNRAAEAKRLKLCTNCLRPGHVQLNCGSTGCKRCKGKHNSLLHKERDDTIHNNEQTTPTVALHNATLSNYTLLSTALIDVHSESNQTRACRVLLDSGSQSNFIVARTAKQLGLRIKPAHIKVSGVNNCTTSIQGKCTIRFKSRCTKFNTELECLVIPEISDTLPQYQFDVKSWRIPENLQLADPSFASPGEIEILLGASIFWKLILVGRVNLGKEKPIAQKTQLGWILTGSVQGQFNDNNRDTQCNFNRNSDIQDQLAKFWEVESDSQIAPLSGDESFCEEHYVKHKQRTEEGRFIVAIPHKYPTSMLGESQCGALKRFFSLERKLQCNPELKENYCSFMKEYEELAHMSRISSDSANKIQYFLPHHGVVNEASSTTRLRVVFDGSFGSSTGYSRNNLECVGPTIQSELLNIILRFREHSVAISADIQKMYRQILVRKEDRYLQQILWREDAAKPVETFQLNTVTYGTASASFLSTRCLKQFALDHATSDPQVAMIIAEDFYVDDLLTGAETIAETICERISTILDSACLPLRKWMSSHSSVLNSIKQEKNEGKIITIGNEERTKTLGLYWAPGDDHLWYKINNNIPQTITKRSILSTISQIYDPLGLLGACIITAKIILQLVWQENLDWDNEIPKALEATWISYREDLSMLNDIKIPRRVICDQPCNIQLHGFADASERAYGACIYVRSVDNSGAIHVNLLCTKSKVAPLKTLTIPRLELCGALVLARLAKRVINSMRIQINEVHLWTDSTIVLGWLNKPVNDLKIYAANRVSQIIDLVGEVPWHHVPTDTNPADLISRGIPPGSIANNKLWWHGPEWLREQCEYWPTLLPHDQITLPELKIKTYHTIIRRNTIQFTRFSNFLRLQRAIAYVLRFVHNCSRPTNKFYGELTVDDLKKSLTTLVIILQSETFSSEIQDLLSNKPLRPQSKLLTLSPFLDEQGVLRVGGRLHNADLGYERKHPILLPSNHRVTKLLFKREHEQLGHAGAQHLLYSIRERFWVIRGKDVARRIVHECIRCYRANPKNVNPLMGSLPSARVTPAYPFESTGVDYAGPFVIKAHKGRGAQSIKCYISLFICFASKAIHLEIVSSLTTEAFIASLKRFTSRRGKPHTIFSDNGTNFTGTNNELKRIVQELETHKRDLIRDLAKEGITWKFIPANSPHFGGLWEAGVKRVKFHLKRILGNASLTFEELSTVCCQVEAILNSRPITPLSNNPNDLEALTPSHFLIGRRLTAIPEDELSSTKIWRLSSFQRLQQLTQHFWKRWVTEYLTTLQPRQRWKTSTPPLQVGMMVLIKNEHLPPLQWPLGRITELHPGRDGINRVATVQTSAGALRRACAKLFPLPTLDDNGSTPIETLIA